MLVGVWVVRERETRERFASFALGEEILLEGDEIVNTKACVIGLVAAVGLASAANATVVATFGYSDLKGSYDHASTKFSAVAWDVGAFQSAGDVTRLIAPGGTAQFEPGFVSNAGNFVISIDVTNKVGSTADGSGSFTITDINGSTVTGDINGNWITPGFGIVFFNGLLSNVVFTDGGAGTFVSNDGGFTLAGLTGNIYSGALVQLFTRIGGGFFNNNFDNVSALVSGDLIPTPGTAALMAIGGMFAIRRNRRR